MTSQAPPPFTFLVPESSEEPIIVEQSHFALKMAIVERHQVPVAVRDWATQSGVYVLINSPGEDGTWRGYVGEASAGLGNRLRTHHSQRSDWRRALLVERDATRGFTSTDAAWLEGELINHLTKAANVRLQNKRQAGDSTLPDYDQASLKTIVTVVAAVLRAIGHDPGPLAEEAGEPAAEASTPQQRGHSRKQTHFRDLVEEGLVPRGTALVSTSPSWPATAQVLADGTIDLAGSRYHTPSAAGKAVRNGMETNGWHFWALETPSGLVRLSELRIRYAEEATP